MSGHLPHTPRTSDNPRYPAPAKGHGSAAHRRALEVLAVLAALLVVAAVGWRFFLIGKRFYAGVEDMQRLEPVARDYLLRTEHQEWERVDDLMCNPPGPRADARALGSLDRFHIRVEGDAGCVTYPTTSAGRPFKAMVKLWRRGDSWCISPHASIVCSNDS